MAIAAVLVGATASCGGSDDPVVPPIVVTDRPSDTALAGATDDEKLAFSKGDRLFDLV
ncbi:MAG: hypothetical protein JST92_24290, partial [Deltaproteobacteria bacterium]|nr:hypothetical protein [Deltaproteobacteria bacterium]